MSEFTVVASLLSEGRSYVTTYTLGGEDAEYLAVETDSEGPVLLVQDGDETPIAAFRNWDAAYRDGVLLETRTKVLQTGREDLRPKDVEPDEANDDVDPESNGFGSDVISFPPRTA